MALALGIDTGGTYTDAVLFDDENGEKGSIIAAAKSLTTKHDLLLGIRGAVEGVLGEHAAEVRLVSLSTTLATNAIVEGQGTKICLLLIGYGEDDLRPVGGRKSFGDNRLAFIPGGHTVNGDESNPLGEDEIREAVRAHAKEVSAFGISGYFGVRNPDHELRAREIVREMTDLPVSCGHELTGELNAPGRALTVMLNARLIPILQSLMLAVEEMLREKGINAPLMVVKGDGSLISAGVALERPVETILSGPAASVVSAKYLAGLEDGFVIDMGGTTTDVGLLREGLPSISPDGAEVGGWKPMVRAARVYTTGLGGDSEVWLEEERLRVGPRRVVPLSLLAHEHPEALNVLREIESSQKAVPADLYFALLQRPAYADGYLPTEVERPILATLKGGPRAINGLIGEAFYRVFYMRAIDALVEKGVVVKSCFTPTDALHVLHDYDAWDSRAAELGARVWARRLNMEVEEFCKLVLDRVVFGACRALLEVALAEDYRLRLEEDRSVMRVLLEKAFGRDGKDSFGVDFTLRWPIVAIGAPVKSFFPAVAGRLHTELVIPRHFHVANAVGAVAGAVRQEVKATVRYLEDIDAFRVYAPFGVSDFPDLEKAVEHAGREAAKLAEEKALKAGAVDIQVKVRREEITATIARGEEYHIETIIKAAALGRPRLG